MATVSEHKALAASKAYEDYLNLNRKHIQANIAGDRAHYIQELFKLAMPILEEAKILSAINKNKYGVLAENLRASFSAGTEKVQGDAMRLHNLCTSIATAIGQLKTEIQNTIQLENKQQAQVVKTKPDEKKWTVDEIAKVTREAIAGSSGFAVDHAKEARDAKLKEVAQQKVETVVANMFDMKLDADLPILAGLNAKMAALFEAKQIDLITAEKFRPLYQLADCIQAAQQSYLNAGKSNPDKINLYKKLETLAAGVLKNADPDNPGKAIKDFHEKILGANPAEKIMKEALQIDKASSEFGKSFIALQQQVAQLKTNHPQQQSKLASAVTSSPTPAKREETRNAAPALAAQAVKPSRPSRKRDAEDIHAIASPPSPKKAG